MEKVDFDTSSKLWLTEWVQNINSQLKADRSDIHELFTKLNQTGSIHTECREDLLTRLTDSNSDVVNKLIALERQVGALAAQVAVGLTNSQLHFRFFIAAILFYGTVCMALGGLLFSHLLEKG